MAKGKTRKFSEFRDFMRLVDQKPSADPAIATLESLCRQHVGLFRHLRWKVPERTLRAAAHDFAKLAEARNVSR